MSRYADLSLWQATAPDDRGPDPRCARTAPPIRPSWGFTGQWTAYYLARADPTLRIAVLEQELSGFGGSGRNGSWLTGGH